MLLRALWKGTHHAFQPSKLKVGLLALVVSRNCCGSPAFLCGHLAALQVPQRAVGVGECSQGLCVGQAVLPEACWPALTTLLPTGNCGQQGQPVHWLCPA